MKKLLVLAGILALCGCTHSVKWEQATPDPYGQAQMVSGTNVHEIAVYAGRVKAEVESHFKMKNKYVGKMCTLRVSLRQSGMIEEVHAEGGDPALCEDAIIAVKASTFPPMTDALYKVFNNAPFDFKP